jgi:dolichyl-phosphate-mannose--protein O-mannosyl transferase
MHVRGHTRMQACHARMCCSGPSSRACDSVPTSTQLVPVVFSIAKKLGCTNRGAVLAAVFVIFDMLNTTESRLVLMDAQVGLCQSPSFAMCCLCPWFS